jgi:hypothetical protein
MKIHEYNQMMSYLTRPAAPKAVPVAREVMAKGSKPVDKKIEKKVVKVAKIPVIPPKPDMPNGHSTWSTDDWLQSIDEGGWVDDRRAGILEYELADEYWRGVYDTYLKNGGTLDFKEFMQQQLKTSSANGITGVLKI